MCFVVGPGLDTNLFTNRILAKVPRTITSSLPRREPYELKSFGVNLKQEFKIPLLFLEKIASRYFFGSKMRGTVENTKLKLQIQKILLSTRISSLFSTFSRVFPLKTVRLRTLTLHTLDQPSIVRLSCSWRWCRPD